MTPEENIRFKEKIIKEQFKNALGYELNLENPKTFNEKLQWLKLYYHDPLMTICADKYLVRDYVKEKIGEEYLVPLIGVWDRVEDIDFDSLPNQFVLKVNWGSGQNIIVKDKSTLNIEETKNKLEYWMKPTSNHYYYSYEWCYKNIKPKIICEKYINENKINEAFVYRMFFFNGVLNYINLDIPFHNTIKNNVKFKSLHFNDKWEKLNIKTRDEIYQSDIDKPYNLENIINIAKTISKPFIFVRVDLFNIRENILFGELTFYPNNGLAQFDPTEWDYKFGELLELPKEKKIEYNILEKATLYNLEPIVKQYKDLEENYNKLKPLEEKIKLYSKKFSLFTIFNIDILSFTSNKEYFILTILGIKIVFKHKVRPDQT
ncbi:ATP-grasp fold amidoligase family protein [Brachyspira hyodysenteriae]|uniref:ATP-grasp fold amidoligase family protein n=1 Tax=Brachyspira hyodysenteriae TaxID=159 RepID=UPI00118271F1|nr:ATP-grasp fold amidoligase family protein [Brachyspira hyodysenteriae]TVL81589.1 glycosyl transferase [Brachyspira hyodysenteriae]